MNHSTLYLMFGYPGAGKTTTAKIIRDLTGAVHLSSDELRLKMFPQPQFTSEEHDKLYKALDDQTRQLLTDGKSVIYDANLNRHQHRQEKYDICQQTGAKPVLVWIHTPAELAKQRATHARRQHLVPKAESPDDMFYRIAGIIESPSPDENPIILDGTLITPDYVKQMLKLT